MRIIQIVTKEQLASATNVLTIASPTPGSVLLLGVVNNQGTSSSVASTGATWVKSKAGGSFNGLDIWAAFPAGTGTSVTVTIPSSGTSCVVLIEVDSFVNGTADQTNTAGGTSTTMATGSVTPSVNGEFIFAIGASFQTPGAPSGGFAAIGNAGGGLRIDAAYLVQTAAAAAQATWTIASANWDGTIASFKILPYVPGFQTDDVSDQIASS